MQTNHKRKHQLFLEITLALIIKLTMLYLLWLLFFSHSDMKSMTIADISQHLFATYH